ncbi:MAG TPA: GIY-YIG nuclease family protein [bacterium]|jgi:predicted GIY-YIG superfamily endonuclease|nr:GIY-YIG nuclease family protein [bacterium]
MISVYLIKSLIDGSYYCGVSKNPKARLLVHNRGGLRVTSIKKPWVLVYTKDYNCYNNARRHEKWLKKKNRKYKDCLAQLAPPEGAG